MSRIRGRRGSPPMERLTFRGWEVSDEGCWNWLGRLNPKGYGVIGTTGTLEGRSQLVHRLIYEELNGVRVGAGTSVMHLCDNRRCVNPDHLRLGSHSENMRDMAEKLRSPHVRLTPDQVRQIRSRTGESHSQLARDFGVSPANIRKIRNRQTWNWLE